MDIVTLGRLIARQRQDKGLTQQDLATRADLGRSTLAALEGGKLSEIGWSKIDRLCRVLDLVLDVRQPLLETPLLPHRHLTQVAGRELTKAAIDDVITNGNIGAWQGLIRAIRTDSTGRLARRTREVAGHLSSRDNKARSFLILLPRLAP